jgi:hypothetical protein
MGQQPSDGWRYGGHALRVRPAWSSPVAFDRHHYPAAAGSEPPSRGPHGLHQWMLKGLHLLQESSSAATDTQVRLLLSEGAYLRLDSETARRVKLDDAEQCGPLRSGATTWGAGTSLRSAGSSRSRADADGTRPTRTCTSASGVAPHELPARARRGDGPRGRAADRHPAPAHHSTLGITSVYLQGIGNAPATADHL